ncbi:hypothetical protein AB0M39_38295 [Streptomyces sp. NPDC051907]|uniref:hypothetical protein n=1 Tax=Streptomyces sp. NPDC051907 TaxID=3155284 RepID=UPI0034281C04
MAETAQFDFYLDADDEYQPEQLPTGVVKMGGKEYVVRCPKDSLPMLLGRIQARAQEAEDPALQEEVITQLVAACFDPDDTADIVERVISPYDRHLSIAFLVDTVQRVYKQYAPLLDKGYEELGIENPIKQPEDRKPSSKKPGARKAVAKKTTAAAKKTAAKRTAARA